MRSRLLAFFVLATAVFSPIFAQAQVPPMINYQGRLVDGTNLYNGSINIKLSVYTSETEAFMLLCEDTGQVSVVDGLYSTYLGDGLASGDMSWLNQSGNKWMEVVINTVTMRPRERLVSVPYAMMSGGVTNGAITTMMIANGAIMSSHISDGSISFADIGANSATNGQIMKWNGSTWVAASDLTSGGGALASYAENGTFTPGPQASGFESIAQGQGAKAGANNSVVGGGYSNTVGYGSDYATIGGGEQNFIGDSSWHSTIAGGYRGKIYNSSHHALIGGGFLNEIYASASYATIAGGYQNDILDNADYGFIGGGFGNEIGSNSFHAAVVGGYGNEINANATNAFIGGGLYNRIDAEARDAAIVGGYSNTVAGGNRASAIGGGQQNRIGDHSQFSVIGGGAGNAMENGPSYSVIGGGAVNKMEDSGDYGFIGGGQGNKLQTNASAAVIAGGSLNTTGPDADFSVIGGGYRNTLDADADYSVIGGGKSNTCGAPYAVVPGGSDNAATGAYSFAAGYRATAAHSNTFVWSDGSGDDRFTSSNANTFIVRAAGGVGIGTADPEGNLHILGNTNACTLIIDTEFVPFPGPSGNSELRLTNPWGGTVLRQKGTDHFEIRADSDSSTPYLIIKSSGCAGIGTTNLDCTYKLSVGGKIRCEGVVVEEGWADYVFDASYRLTPLDEVERTIRAEKRLPDMPTEAQVRRDGLDLGQTQVLLLQKIEELTLYAIEQNKKLRALEEEVRALREGSSRD